MAKLVSAQHEDPNSGPPHPHKNLNIVAFIFNLVIWARDKRMPVVSCLVSVSS